MYILNENRKVAVFIMRRYFATQTID